MRKETEIHSALIGLMKERGGIETEMENQDKYRDNHLAYYNLEARRSALITEIRILQWILEE